MYIRQQKYSFTTSKNYVIQECRAVTAYMNTQALGYPHRCFKERRPYATYSCNYLPSIPRLYGHDTSTLQRELTAATPQCALTWSQPCCNNNSQFPNVQFTFGKQLKNLESEKTRMRLRHVINTQSKYRRKRTTVLPSPIQLCRRNELSPSALCQCPPMQHRYPQLLKTWAVSPKHTHTHTHSHVYKLCKPAV